MKTYLLLTISIISLILSSCNSKTNSVTPAFYYWKTTLDFTPEENQRLSDLKVKKLYVRFFDINLQAEIPVPVAKLIVSNLPPSNIKIIPVVFITNKTLAASNGQQIDTLAGNIVKLIKKTAEVNNIWYKELQIDCDWSLSTKEKYFSLLRLIKKDMPEMLISSTIRLHQVKHYKTTGIPPVDRGMLMFYNMGDIQSINNNSIYNETDTRKYTASLNNYPLKMDVALPVFTWVKHFNKNKLKSLINEISEKELREEKRFTFKSGQRYEVLENMLFRGQYLQQGDMLVAEEVTPQLAKQAAGLLTKYFKSDSITVAIYHWDKVNLSRYDNQNFQDLYHAFK